MGAAAFDMVAERQTTVVGMAGISLEQYALCIGAQLSMTRGLSLAVQMIHRSELRELLQDLADTSQPRFSELTRLVGSDTSTANVLSKGAATGGALVQALEALATSEQRAHAESAVLRVVYELTGAPDSSVKAETPLMEAGVDSLAATELSSRLRSLAGVSLSPTIVFDHPTPRAIAAHLLEQLVGIASASAPAVAVAGRMGASTLLRLHGATGSWPGGCGNEQARWLMQAASGDAMSGVPSSRWVLEVVIDRSSLTSVQQACVQHGGFMSGAELFAHSLFDISLAEAAAVDPQ